MPVTTRKPAAAAKRVARPAAAAGVTVRMYRHGLGDCFLLRLPRDDGSGHFNILIDCGLITVADKAKEKMRRVVADIALACDRRIDVVVMTHEHWDHASGFSPQQAQDLFDHIDIGEVWYAWTEDPENALGNKLRDERAAKQLALAQAVRGLRAMGTPVALRRADGVSRLLGFFGLDAADTALSAAALKQKIGKSREAFEYLKNRRDVKTRYLVPGKDAPRMKGVSGVRVYVLGPPQDEGFIKKSAPTKAGQEVYEFASDLAVAESLSCAFLRFESGHDASLDRDRPFDDSFSRRPDDPSARASNRLHELWNTTWFDTAQDWRKIEDDWTAAAESLALNLDNHTNNTCVVLAFEIVASGRVLLFPADAQVGNWLSWQKLKWKVKDGERVSEVTVPDLLQRTVFYKVGHHGSHNATLRALGLEQMTSEELMAFVPVDRAQAKKNGWNKMPFAPLVKRLHEKTGGRVIMTDDDAPPTEGELSALSAADRRSFVRTLKSDPKDLFYEYSFD